MLVAQPAIVPEHTPIAADHYDCRIAEDERDYRLRRAVAIGPGDVIGANKILDRFTVAFGKPEKHHPLLRILLVSLNQARCRFMAGRSPVGPQIEHHDFAT